MDAFATSPAPSYLDCLRGHRFSPAGNVGQPVDCDRGGHVEFACHCGAILAVVPVRDGVPRETAGGTPIPPHWYWTPCQHTAP